MKNLQFTKTTLGEAALPIVKLLELRCELINWHLWVMDLKFRYGWLP